MKVPAKSDKPAMSIALHSGTNQSTGTKCCDRGGKSGRNGTRLFNRGRGNKKTSRAVLQIYKGN